MLKVALGGKGLVLCIVYEGELLQIFGQRDLPGFEGPMEQWRVVGRSHRIAIGDGRALQGQSLLMECVEPGPQLHGNVLLPGFGGGNSGLGLADLATSAP